MAIHYYSVDSSPYLSHHGILGMKWGVRNAETRAKYAAGNGGQLPKTRARKFEKRGTQRKALKADLKEAKKKGTKYEKTRGIYKVGGKTVQKSYWSNRADKKVKKYAYKAVMAPSTKNTLAKAKWENKQMFENARDVGRTKKTASMRRAGKATIVAGLAVNGALAVAAPAAAGVAILAGSAMGIAGYTANRLGKKREFRSGYDILNNRKVARQYA